MMNPIAICSFHVLIRRDCGKDLNLWHVSNECACVISGIVNKPARNTIRSVDQRIVFCDAIYFIWQERNSRRFAQIDRNLDGLFKVIVEIVRLKILGLSLECTPDVLKAAMVWNFTISKDRLGRNKRSFISFKPV